METLPETLRPRGRPRQFDRDAALETAMRLFWTRGFEATSIHDLATAIGINAPSLYAAFGDKKRLFRETIGRYRSGCGNFAAPAIRYKPTARLAIESLLLAAAEAYTLEAFPHGCMVIHSGANCTAQSDDIAAELAGMRAELDAALAERIANGQADGDVPARVDANALAAFFGALLQGMSTHARDGASTEMLRSIAQRAMKSWPGDD
jgi:TetR/AcrR family transcriptional regulator, copper-responsive repressor